VVASLQTGTVYVTGGTNTSIGLDTALTAFDLSKKAGRAVLFISDGDDLGTDPSQSALKLNAAGIRLLVAGAGTAAGGTVPVTDANTGTVTENTDASGNPLVRHLNEPFLRALAGAASGRYLGSDLSVLPGLVKGQLDTLQQSQVDSESTTIPIERYQWFVAAALILLVLASLAEYLPPLRWPARRGAAVALTALLVLLPACATSAYNATERGREAFRSGDINSAVTNFQQAATGHSDNPVADLNLAAALYGAVRYDEAIIAARRALNANDNVARGNAYASIGHAQFAAGRLNDALDSFKHALIENPGDAASRHDYEVVLQLSGTSNPPPQTPGAGTSPTPAPSGTPGPSQPGPGDSGTPPNDANGDATPSPTSAPSRNESDIATELRSIDDQVQQILNDSKGQPDAEQALKILQLLDQRTRIAQLRDPGGANSGPNDY
jgi:Ca-activated chloride channel family protein